jgi:hypothetical protein
MVCRPYTSGHDATFCDRPSQNASLALAATIKLHDEAYNNCAEIKFVLD